MKQAIFTYDYELFFGDRSGTVMRTLIKPTNVMLDFMEKIGIKGTFFVDYLMLKYLSKNNDDRSKNDLQTIVEQLEEIIRRGHRIELHIHPHWVDAKYNGDGTWDFSDFSHYNLQSFPEDEVVNMFNEGCELLYSIIHKVDNNYKIIAFRAGGWAVQPFSHLKRGFESTGIFVDSSASYGVKSESKDSKFNFNGIPNKNYYRFENDVEKEDKKGRFIEIPISSYYRLMIYKVFDRLTKKLSRNMTTWSDGSSYRSDDNVTNNRKWRFFNRFMYNTTCASLFTAVCASFFSRKSLLVFIDHPKDFTNYTLTSLKIISKYVNSITYKEFVDRMILE